MDTTATREYLDLQTAREQHLADLERRYTPIALCPWGCDGSGWREMEEGEQPGNLAIFHNGGWLTPCGCNLVSTHWDGRQHVWPPLYPADYAGPRVMPPCILCRTNEAAPHDTMCKSCREIVRRVAPNPAPPRGGRQHGHLRFRRGAGVDGY